MIDAVVDFIHHNLGAELAVFIAAAFPVVEVRGAIPLGISLGLSPFDTLVTSLVGSMLPVPFILLALRRLFRFLSQFQPFKKLVDRLTARTLAKGKQVKRYGMWGLLLFVGVPIPGTGVWTGSMIAVLLGLPLRGVLPTIFCGNLIAALAVLLLTQGVAALF
jgi:uncharacterized membrane protein